VTTRDDGLGYPEGDVALVATYLGRLLAELPSITSAEVSTALEEYELTLTNAAQRLEERATRHRTRIAALEGAVRASCTRCRVIARGEPAWSWRECTCVVDCGLDACEFRKVVD
jgi:hypothetical protein